MQQYCSIWMLFKLLYYTATHMDWLHSKFISLHSRLTQLNNRNFFDLHWVWPQPGSSVKESGLVNMIWHLNAPEFTVLLTEKNEGGRKIHLLPFLRSRLPPIPAPKPSKKTSPKEWAPQNEINDCCEYTFFSDGQNQITGQFKLKFST